DIRLLTTVASSMGVALENARLFDETQRLLKVTEDRAAELAIINSVQAGLASKLDMQAIYDLVGDKIRETFNAEVVYIAYRDLNQPDRIDFPYFLDQGKRINLPPLEMGQGLTSLVINSKQPQVFGTRDEQIEHGAVIDTGDLAQSFLGVPISIGENVAGVVSVQSYEKNIYQDGDIRLLTTLASSMSVALENARLFAETQRLLKITEDRAAELAVINSIQQGLAAELDFQTIIDLVGDKLREVLNTGEIGIRWYEQEANLIHYLYEYEHGERITVPSVRPGVGGTWEKIVLTRKPVIFNSIAEFKEAGGVTIPGTDQSKSTVYIPIVGSDRVLGQIITENYEKENAYTEADIRLLTTVASSMGVALENARLLDETQRLLKETEQRAQELAIINSVQEALASKLEFQAIIDAVGDKLRTVLDADSSYIALYNREAQVIEFPYWNDLGKYLANVGTLAYGEGITSRVLETGEPLLIGTEAEMLKLGAVGPRPGESVGQSWLGVPIRIGADVRGALAVYHDTRQNAFGESDLRLLSTLANSVSVALENARLFDETQRLLKETEQRAQELAIINSVQEGLASKLDMQAIFELVGDKIQSMFNAQSVIISSFDHDKQVSRLDYGFENGNRVFDTELLPFSPMNRHLISTRQPVVINENASEASKQYGLTTIEGTQTPKSLIYVPFGTGTQVNGYFSLQNMDRENAFTESDVRLLQTLAGSMGIALENARLFNAEQQRAAELSAISTVTQALVAETEVDNMIQLIGSQMREIFDADIVYVALLDPQTDLIHFPYQIGEEFTSLKLGEGLTSRIIQSGEPLLINKDIKERRAELGTSLVGREALSYLGVPIKSGKETIGVLSVQSTTQEGMFNDDSLRLLTTIAANAGAAIQTAQLHGETQRRAREMATLAEIGNDIAATRELEPVLEKIAVHASEILRVRDIVITLRDADGNTFRATVALGKYIEELKKVVITANKGIMGHILASGMAEFVNDPSHDPRVIHVPGTPEEEDQKEYLMGAPLISRGQTIGGIMVWRQHPDSLFTQADLDFLVSVARQTAIAIESA
ncbi:MAG: GAF domain-containing protein, partial [Anaerolineales bacterium]